MLDYVRKHLLEDTPQPNEMSAVVEGTAAALIQFVSGKIDFEIDCARDREIGERKSRFRLWRKIVLEATREYAWDFDPRKMRGGWKLALELLHDRILHDRDYEMDFGDRPPEKSETVNKALGIGDDYYTTIPLPEPDGPEMLDLIQRVLNAF